MKKFLFLCIALFALLALTNCSDHYTYEFWSCDQSKNEINVIKLPKTYKPTKLLGLRIIDDPFLGGNKLLSFRYNFVD